MTDTDKKVLVVKVHRNAVGTAVPFDKLYFFPKGQLEAIPKIFGYALVFPCEDSLMAEITKLRPKALNAYRHRRDDALLNQKIDIDGRKNTAEEVATWWADNVTKPYALQDRVVVIPVLTSKIRKKLNPRYLAAPRWFDKSVTRPAKTKEKRKKRSLKVTGGAKGNSDAREAISGFAYLATPMAAPNDRITPICNICPRQLLHLQGQCMPGQAICLKSLNFNDIGKTKTIDNAVPAEENEDELEDTHALEDSDEEGV